MFIEHLTLSLFSFQSWSDTAEVINDMAEYFTTREQQQLLKEFYYSNHQFFGESEELLSKSLVTVEKNLNWAETHLEGLVKYLADRNGSSCLGATSLVVVLLLAVGSMLAWP